MNDSSEMDRLLGDAREGGEFESEGVFTTASIEAVKKLAQFQLPRHSAWLLKVAQAAVCSGSSELRIKQSRKSTRIEFHQCEEFDFALLLQIFLRAQVAGSTAAEHLAIGLRNVALGQEREFSLRYEHGTVRRTLVWDGTVLDESTEETVEIESPLLLLEVKPKMVSSQNAVSRRIGRARVASEDYLELVRGCQACSIPVIFDGRRLDTLTALPSIENTSDCHHWLLSIGWVYGNDIEHQVSVPGGVWSDSKDVGQSKPMLQAMGSKPKGPDDKADYLIKVWFNYRISTTDKEHGDPIRTRSLIYWVKNGVVCDTEELKQALSAVSVEVFISADGLATDLSGLKLLESTERSERTLEHLGPLLQHLRRTLVAFSAQRPGISFEKELAFGVATTAAGLLLVPFTGGISFFCVPFAIALRYMGRGKLEELVADLCREKLERLCEYTEKMQDGKVRMGDAGLL